ncbi:hypothetical protein KPATCC21470_2967 [Kitasatospora purpeofusca]
MHASDWPISYRAVHLPEGQECYGGKNIRRSFSCPPKGLVTPCWH